MKLYELTYLVSSGMPTEEIKGFSRKISGFVSEQGGLIESESEPSRKNLAGKRESYLVSLVFRTDKINTIEEKIKTEGTIIRYMILAKKEPSLKAEKPARFYKKPAEPSKAKKAELKEIDEKIEEILNQ